MINALLFAGAVLIWGSTWYAIDKQLGVVDPAVSLTYRYAIAAALMFGWCLVRGLPLQFPRRAHAVFALLGLFLFALNYLAAYEAQFYISSALNAIGFSSMLWMNILNARLLLGRRASASVYWGAALGIAGILIIFLPEVQSLALDDRVLLGLGLSLLGALLASLGNIASQAAQGMRLPVVQTNAWGMLYGAVCNALLATGMGKTFNFDPSLDYMLSLLYLAVFGSVVAFSCYLTLLGRVGLERAGYAAVMIPMVALALSVALEGLEVGSHIIAGLAIALAGNVFVLTRSTPAPLVPDPRLINDMEDSNA
ncbi:MAG: EamA family transporter [Gammaproteobacteria bacterium]|jgi:drug/metabolite transporter (DMT)-like permease|nr:EamA family transporter [Gammaproteobacteria bacterium]